MRLTILISGLTAACLAPQAAAQYTYQTTLNPTGGTGLGATFAISADGTTAIVGSPLDNSQNGYAYVFVRNNGTWSLQASKLAPSGVGETFGHFGSSVSLSADGNTAVIGASGGGNGGAWIFTRSGGTWTEGPKLFGTGYAGIPGEGSAVALSEDANTAFLCAAGDNFATGACWVFTRSGNTWTQQGQKLTGSGGVGPFVSFGQSLALSADGSTAIVGANGDTNSTGAAWIFVRSGNAWIQQGDKLVGTGATAKANQSFSVAISSDGNTAILGRPLDQDGVGAAWAFTRSVSTWSELAKFSGAGAVGTAQQGTSVAISGDGNTAVLGGPNDDFLLGAAWVFKRTGGTWTQQGTKLTKPGSGGFHGTTLALTPDASTLLVGGGSDAWVFTQPALSVSESHVGAFIQGQAGATYTVMVSNAAGAGPISGTVTVTETVPSGLTLVSMTGAGWSCPPGGTSCTRSDLLTGGASYPPITVTVNVASNSASPAINQVSVSVGGAATSTASDPTTILPAFADILPTDSFLPAIDLLRESGITTGCSASPPMYCSTSNITEAQMAVFIVRSVMGGDNFTYTQTPYFSDVPVGYLYFPWIQKMQDLGIAVACGAGQFCPETPVTRGIMAVLIIRARYGVPVPVDYPVTPYFTDVPATHPYFPWIQKMKQFGITTGCGSTTYCPDDPVTRGQMAVFIMRGEFNQLLPSGTPVVAWAYPASASAGQTVTVTILGQNTNFSTTLTQVNAGTGIIVSNIAVANGTTLTAQFAVAPGAASGPRSITVTTGSEEATLPNGFKVQ